jgi:hypothetical protein
MVSREWRLDEGEWRMDMGMECRMNEKEKKEKYQERKKNNDSKT